MAENDKFGIKLHVYDTEISVRINRDDEALYRRSAKLATDRLNAYSNYYNGRKGKTEIDYMALIDVGLMYERERFRSDSAPFVKSMKKITEEIEKALSEE